MCYQTFHGRRSRAYDRMSGLDSEQLEQTGMAHQRSARRAVAQRNRAPEGPFPARSRHRSLRLHATEHNPGSVGGNIRYVAAGNLWNYLRNSRRLSRRPPKRTGRPSEAKEAAAREQTVLVDGFLAPTWSWRDTPELWSENIRRPALTARPSRTSGAISSSCPSPLPGIIAEPCRDFVNNAQNRWRRPS